MLGRAEKVTIDKENTTIVHGLGDKQAIVYGICHCINTTQSVEIQTTDYFGLRYQLIGKFFVVIVK